MTYILSNDAQQRLFLVSLWAIITQALSGTWESLSSNVPETDQNALQMYSVFLHKLKLFDANLFWDENNTLPSLHILLIQIDSGLKLNIHYNSINKNDLLQFYSYHNNKIEAGLLTGFY